MFGYPPLANDPERLLVVISSILFASFVLLNTAHVGAIARDIERTAVPPMDRAPSAEPVPGPHR